ncbi:MAG: hypothetical protein Q9186_002539 [Xanthomendoza sp. 1 TL-2023]
MADAALPSLITPHVILTANLVAVARSMAIVGGMTITVMQVASAAAITKAEAAPHLQHLVRMEDVASPSLITPYVILTANLVAVARSMAIVAGMMTITAVQVASAGAVTNAEAAHPVRHDLQLGNPSNTFAPPELSGSVSCPANNGSRYTDAVGQRWEVHCGQEIRGTNARAVHADSWEKCLEFCSILGSVVGVTYPGGGGDNSNLQSINCYPFNVFQEYRYGAVPTLVAARPLNGSTGNYFNQDVLCPRYENETYIDYYGRVYEIRCNHAYGGGTNLAPTVTKSLEGCLSFCSTYNTCVGVSFTQYIRDSQTVNCFPKSTLGEFTYQAGNSSAQLITQ